MTDDKNFKRLVNARMAETGQSYTSARDALLATVAPGGDMASSTPRAVARQVARDARTVTGHRGLVGS